MTVDISDERFSKQYKLLPLPSDVLLCCIAPYLCKWDQYQWFSTCISHKPWLLHVRTVRIHFRIPTMKEKMEDKKLSMNVYWLNWFLRRTDRQRLLKAVGCLDTTNNLRKLRLDITRNALIQYWPSLLDIAPYLYRLNVDNSKQFENPTELAITRWLHASNQSFEIPNSETDLLQVIRKQIAELNGEMGEPHQANPQVKSWNEVRGANAVVITNDKEYTVDLGANADTYLQSVACHHCSIVNVPDVPHVTLKYCNNITNYYASSARVVHLVGMTIGDLSMLGKISHMIVKDCKVIRFPIPNSGTGQTWEFSNVDIVDVSGLQSLENLTLRDCKYVKDGRMLGHVQTLTIEGGNMQHFPVPMAGKGQKWTLSKVGIVDVSGLAFLESLTLIECHQVTDLSVLGAVRYLNIEGCDKLVLTEQYPKPAGRLQEWTLKSMDICEVDINQFGSLHQFTLLKCTVSAILHVSTAITIKCLELNTTNISRELNFSYIKGKAILEDKATLCTASYLWCNYQSIAKMIYGDIEKWDVSIVKDMSFAFAYCDDFNDNISNWNVSNVTNMSCMFHQASSFNQPLDSWNVSNVTNMSCMFHQTSSFNQPLDSWNVSNITNMSDTFHGASSFNQPLDSWNVSNVTNMRCMFHRASSFNQPMDSWNVSNVKDMFLMFAYAPSFNQSLDSWNVSNVTYMGGMFDKDSSMSMEHFPRWLK